MDIKGLVWVVTLIAIVGGVWAIMSYVPAPVATEEHALTGVLQENRDYKYSEETDIYTIEAYWPEAVPLPTTAAAAKARLVLEKDLKARIDEFKKDGGFATMTEEDKKIQRLDGTRKYALSIEYTDYDAPGYHSYFYVVYADTLGAHPNTYFFTHVFDTEGNEVALGDVLKNNPNWLEELSLLVSNDVVAQYKERAEVDDVTGLIYDEGLAPKVENFENWYLDDATLVIELPPYQVAAYALGSFGVRIPLADINK